MIATVLGSLLLGSPTVKVRVDGEGYLRFARGGEVVYAKSAELTLSGGELASSAGPKVLPKIVVSGDASEIRVSLDGRVTCTTGAGTVEVGQLVLAVFGDDLRPVESDGFFKVFGKPQLGDPGEGLFGVVRTGDEVKTAVETTSAPVKTSGHVADRAFLSRGGAEVVLRDVVTVKGGSYTMADIGEIYADEQVEKRLGQIVLGTTPPIGIDRRLDVPSIQIRLRQLGVDVESVRLVGAASVKVRAEAQTIQQAELEAAAVKTGEAQYGPMKVDARSPVAPMVVPMGQVSLVSESVSRSGASVSVVVAVQVDGKRINSRTVRLVSDSVPTNVRIGEQVPVIVVSNDVKVETSGRVKKIDQATGLVTVEVPTGKTVSGYMNKAGQVEVKA